MSDVIFDYDEMVKATEKLQAVQMALIGILNTGMAEGALNGIFEIIDDVSRIVNPIDRERSEIKI